MFKSLKHKRFWQMSSSGVWKTSNHRMQLYTGQCNKVIPEEKGDKEDLIVLVCSDRVEFWN